MNISWQKYKFILVKTKYNYQYKFEFRESKIVLQNILNYEK